MARKIRSLIVLACAGAACPSALAQIYNVQTNQPIPGTQGVGVGPGAGLSNWDTPTHNLEYADLTNNLVDGNVIHNSHLDLTGAKFSNSWLNYAEFFETILDSVNFTGADLTGADFTGASLNNTNFTDAIIAHANIGYISQSQFYSTGSYQTKNVQGVNFDQSVSGWDFTGCDLTGCSFYAGNANPSIGANLSNAIVANADFAGFTSGLPTALSVTASYQSKDLHGVNFSNSNLTGWDLSGQNLTACNFSNTTLASVNFANAVIAEANLETASMTISQVISTASYQNFDLHGVAFGNINLTGIDLRNQNLSNAGFSGTNLTGANLSGENLINGDFYLTNLTNANLSGANLTGAHINSIITGANVTGATISQANFDGWGLSAAQFYSTANYANKDLQGANIDQGSMAGFDFSGFNLSNTYFQDLDFTGASFAGANLCNTSFGLCTIEGADLTNATLNHTTFICNMTAGQLYSTASYKAHTLRSDSLQGDMTGWDFSGQDLTGTVLNASSLAGTNFTGAIVAQVAFFGSADLSQAQLDSTASFQNKDLHGIILGGSMIGWNFDGQNLEDAQFAGDITDATFLGADLAGAFLAANLTLNSTNFTSADLIGARCDTTLYTSAVNFTDADLRGAGISGGLTTTNCILRNTVLPAGTIQGLALLPGDQLTIHNYSIPISVLTSMTLASGSILQMDFDANPWTSTITTPAGVTPQLAGTLSLTFIDGADPTTLIGTNYQLFDWSQVPNGSFDQITDDLPVGLYWDLSDLYTTGQITLLPEPALPIAAIFFVASLWRKRPA